MNKLRIRYLDINYAKVSNCIPLVDATDQAEAQLIADALFNVSNPAPAEIVYQTQLAFVPFPPSGGATPLVYDVAVLAFLSAGPFGLKLPIFGPKAIFLPDDITVNPDDPDVLTLIARVIAYGADDQGNEIVSYVSGKRAGAGGP